MKNRLLGGLYGLLIGDAVGVPYEFRRPQQIPPLAQIEMIPPAGYDRAWTGILPGTYSDDGAQALCLLQALSETQQPKALDVEIAQQHLINWMYDGYMSVDSNTFDIGNQTGAALRARGANMSIDGLDKATFCGNGSLMRALPVALWLVYRPHSIAMHVASQHSLITHPYIRNRISVALYTALATFMLREQELDHALRLAIAATRTQFQDPEHQEEVELVIAGENSECRGTGYVVDSLWSAIMAVRRGQTYKECVQYAIEYGNDTDTTACIAGGLAGIIHGYDGLDADWLAGLRGRELIDPLAAKLLEHHKL